MDYDEEANVMYVRFRHGKIVDSQPRDADGMVLASLDSAHRRIGLVVMHASALA